MKTAKIVKLANAFVSELESFSSELETEIDEMEEKQGERENEVRGEKIDLLSEIKDDAEGLIAVIEDLLAKLETDI